MFCWSISPLKPFSCLLNLEVQEGSRRSNIERKPTNLRVVTNCSKPATLFPFKHKPLPASFLQGMLNSLSYIRRMVLPIIKIMKLASFLIFFPLRIHPLEFCSQSILTRNLQYRLYYFIKNVFIYIFISFCYLFRNSIYEVLHSSSFKT